MNYVLDNADFAIKPIDNGFLVINLNGFDEAVYFKNLDEVFVYLKEQFSYLNDDYFEDKKTEE